MEYILNKSAVISTTPQSDREKWLQERYGLITGTKYYGIIFSKTKEEKVLHAKKICGIIPDTIKPEDMAKVQYGNDNESVVRDSLNQLLGTTIFELGVVRMSPDSIFACSIDGILENGEIVELKTTGKPTPTVLESDFSEIPLTYRWQMTHNIACTGAPACHYYSYSYTSDSYYYRYYPFDQKLWKTNSSKATKYYKDFIDPIYDLSTRTVRATPLKFEYEPKLKF